MSLHLNKGPHQRQMKEILYTRHRNTVAPMMVFKDRNATLQAFHTDAVNKDASVDSLLIHQKDTACTWLVRHSRGRGDCANCIHLSRLSGSPATHVLGESCHASPQHGWRSAYSLRKTLSPIYWMSPERVVPLLVRWKRRLAGLL